MRRALAPSFSDFLFIALIGWLFLSGKDGWSRLLLDGDTGWHIRVGEYVLDNATVPRVDLFSFTRPGEPWFAWEWGADVVYALLHRAWGLKGVVVFAAAQVAFYATILMRYTVWRGSNALLTLAVGLLAVGASSLHYLARPHLWTLMLLPASLWLLERDRKEQTPLVWLLVPVTMAWTNLHGGFLAFIACLGLMTVGTAAEEYWRGTREWGLVRRYGLLTGGCLAATLVNPYGYHLHRHIASYLTSDWIRLAVEEFQSPSFRSENILQFEALLLVGLLATASALSRKSVVGPLWLLFWAHQSLGSVRHVTVFVTVAAPVLAYEATLLWNRVSANLPKASVGRILNDLGADMVRNFRWTSLWPAAAVLALFGLDLGIRWPQDFPDLRFPTRMVSQHQERIRSGRVLTTDQWADYLIYRFYPSQRVFFDGRSDFYGPALGQQYVRVSAGGHDWKQILEKHEIDSALVPVDWSLASLLKQDRGWKLIEDDGKSLFFTRVGGSTRVAAAKSVSTELMKSPTSSEALNGEFVAMKHSKIPRTTPSADAGTPPPAEAWRLPSGQPLAEFALRGGLVAPALLRKPPASEGFLVVERERQPRRGSDPRGSL